MSRARQGRLIELSRRSIGDNIRTGRDGRFITSPLVIVKHRQGRSADVPVPAECMVLPVVMMSRAQEKRIQAQLGLCVKSATHEGHVKWWALWQSYALSSHQDLYLRTSEQFQRVIVVSAFFCHLVDAGRSLHHIKEVLKAMKFFFLQALLDVDFLNHEIIVRLRESAKPVGRSAFNAKRCRRKEPVTIDMLVWIRENFRSTVEERLTYIGVALGFHFMLRASEFVYMKPNRNEVDEVHALKYEDVNVLTMNGVTISLEDSLLVSDNCIHGFKFVITCSKTDKFGNGRFLVLLKDGASQSLLVRDLMSHVRESKIRRGDVFMSRWKGCGDNRKETNLKLTSKMVSHALKTAATAFGLDSCHFSPHSLRSGGATQLAVSGASANHIDRVGGWGNKTGGRAAGYQRSTPYDHGALGSVDGKRKVGSLTTRDLLAIR